MSTTETFYFRLINKTTVKFKELDNKKKLKKKTKKCLVEYYKKRVLWKIFLLKKINLSKSSKIPKFQKTN